MSRAWPAGPESRSLSRPRLAVILLALIACLPAFFASNPYFYPPHALVEEHNHELASMYPVPCTNESDTTYENPIACAEAGITAVYPSVDNDISSDGQTSVLWSYASRASDQSRTSTDSDGCTSYFHKTFQRMDLGTNFTLVRGNGSANYSIGNLSDNPVVIPSELLSDWNGTGVEFLLEARLVFFYSLDRTISTWQCDQIGACSCVEYLPPGEYFNITRTVRSNVTYFVEGGQPIHFLSKPLLHEQWAGDPQFEDIMFSDRRFHLASLSLDGSGFAESSIYEFNITNATDRTGRGLAAWKIISYPVSNSSNMNVSQETSHSFPSQIISSNRSYSMAAWITARPKGTGWRNVTLNLTDFFGNSFQEDFTFANRMLTFGNSTGEDGSTDISDSSRYRPSAPIPQGAPLSPSAGLPLAVAALAILAAAFGATIRRPEI